MIDGIYIHAQMLLDIDIIFMQLCMLYVYANDHACMVVVDHCMFALYVEIKGLSLRGHEVL